SHILTCMHTTEQVRSLTPAARMILDTAGRLFYERGIAAVGVDAIAAEAGVTKKTMYDQFGSKAALVVAYLEERDQDFRHLVESSVAEQDGPARVLAVFDALGEWMDGRSPQGCAFVHAHGELVGSPEHPAHDVIRAQKAWLRELFEDLLASDGHEPPHAGATQPVVLIEGATVLRATSEIPNASAEARRAAELIIDRRAGIPAGEEAACTCPRQIGRASGRGGAGAADGGRCVAERQ